jgi:autotransporter-associated beta strand protein
MASTQALNFQFVYDDAAGTGFFDQVLGAQRRQSLSAAADVWGRLILSSYADEIVTVHASFVDYAAGSPVLAAASPVYYYSEFSSTSAPKFADTNYPKALANHLAGGNLSTRADITIKVNKAQPFNFGIGAPTAAQFDFISVAAHEIGHGLGFTGSFRQDGDYGVYGDGSHFDVMLPEMLPKPYDQFLTLGRGGPSLLGLSGNNREAAMTSGNIFWSGANGIAGNGGSAPQLFAPSGWIDGSSISHSNDATAVMFPSFGLGDVRRTPIAAERGMMRDMGWTLSVFSSELNWSGASGSRQFSQAANWMGGVAPLPGDSLAFGAAGASSTNIDVDVALYSVGRMWFTAAAPAYTLNFLSGTDTTFTGAGIVNESAMAPTLKLATGSAMAFEELAKAGNANFVLAGGETRTVPTQTSYYFDRKPGATIAMRMSSDAERGNFIVGGGAGNGGIKAQLSFHGATTAGDAVIFNGAGRAGEGDLYNGRPTIQFGFGGDTRFEDGSDAGRAHITNQGILSSASQGTGGYTTFAGSSSAANATVVNLGGDGYAVGGVTEFVDSASAGTASFTNYSGRFVGAGRTAFFGHSSADRASILNRASATATSSGSGEDWGLTAFREFSTAGNATIVNEFLGRTEFFDDASASHATIRLAAASGSAGGLAFNDRATADGADIVSVLGSIAAGFARSTVIFRDASSAGSATFRVGAGGAALDVAFNDHSTAGNARFMGGPLGPSNRGQVLFSQFSDGGSASFTVGPEASVVFSDNSNAANAVLTVSNGFVVAGRNSSLGNARISVSGYDTVAGGAKTVQVYEGATLGNATIELGGGTTPNARGAELALENTQRAANERAGRATIIVHGGQNGGQGATASIAGAISAPGLRLMSESNGLIRLERQSYASQVQSYEVGSIEGSGRFEITGVDFRTGALGTSTTVSGPISGIVQNFIKVGAGTLSLDGVNTYYGPTSVDAGVLAVNGSINGDVFVKSGAALQGSGNVGGKVTVSAGGILAPGNSPGTLHIGAFDLQPGGTLEMQLGASARDLLVIAGNASFTGTLSFESWGGWLAHAGDTITLFQVGGASQYSFSQVLFPDWAPGFQYRFADSGTGFQLVALNDAQAMPVPEPGSFALMLFGIAAIGAWRFKPCRAEAV